MAQKVHDHFAKQYLAYILDDKGKFGKSHEISDTSLQVDLIFTPNNAEDMQALGLLGQIASRFCVLEVFWGQPKKTAIRTCLTKLFLTHNELHNEARTEKKSLKEEELPHLWILTTSASQALLNGCHATAKLSQWCEGFYFFGDVQKTAIIAINQLPKKPETLWLRLLGQGKIRQQAIDELMALPEDNILRAPVLKLIYNYLKTIEGQSKTNPEEKELIMELSPAYYQWEKETIEKAHKEGRKEGIRTSLESLFKIRFGGIDKALAPIIEPLLQLPSDESLRLVLQSSREDLLAKFVA